MPASFVEIDAIKYRCVLFGRSQVGDPIDVPSRRLGILGTLRLRHRAFELDGIPLQALRHRRKHPGTHGQTHDPLDQRLQELRLEPPEVRAEKLANHLHADMDLIRGHLRLVLRLQVVRSQRAPDLRLHLLFRRPCALPASQAGVEPLEIVHVGHGHDLARAEADL